MKKTVLLLVLIMIMGMTTSWANEATSGLYLANTAIDKRFGFIDMTGKFTINQQYDSVQAFNKDGYAIVKTTDLKYGVINKTGQFVIPANYNYIESYVNGYAVFSDSLGNWGILDSTGSIIIKPEYQRVFAYNEGVAIGLKIDNNGKSTYFAFDTKGNILFSGNGNLNDFHNGLAMLYNTDTRLYGYVDKLGNFAIKPRYTFAQDFSNGTAEVVQDNNNRYIIDTTGKILEKLGSEDRNYQYRKFEDGFYIKSSYNGLSTLYNPLNEVVIPQAKSIYRINTELYVGSKPSKTSRGASSEQIPKAFFNKNGVQLTDYIFYTARELEKGLIVVSTDDQTYVMDNNLREISSFKRLPGLWRLSLEDELIKAECYKIIRYYSKKGTLIFQSDGAFSLKNNVRIICKTYNPNMYNSILYPKIETIGDKKLKNIINQKIKSRFINKDIYKTVTGFRYGRYVNSNFNQIGDVFHIEVNGSVGSLGESMAAPVQIKKDYYFDLKTGKEYTLDDLFNKKSDYRGFIESNEFHMGGAYGLNDNGRTRVKYDEITTFTVLKDKIVLHYLVYSITGLPPYSCELSYSQLDKYIDKAGEFWRNISNWSN